MSEMTVEEARKLALLKQQIPTADRSLHEQALVTLLTAYESQRSILEQCARYPTVGARGARKYLAAMSGSENTTP